MRLFFFVLFSSLLFVSCSGQKPSKASFNFDMSLQGVGAGTNLVVFGKDTNGARFTRIIGSGSLTMELPKGNWTFGAMAWDGDQPFKGKISCALKSTLLSQESITIDLTLKNETCFDSAFSNEAGMSSSEGKTAFPIRVQFCEEDVSGNTTQGCTYFANSPTSGPKPGFIGSYKFSIRGRNTLGKEGNAESLDSLCFQNKEYLDTTGAMAPSEVNIPEFNKNLDIPFQVEAFLSPDCDRSKGVITVNSADPKQYKIHQNIYEKYLYMKTPLQQICMTSDFLNNKTSFASGLGTVSVPFVICSKEQLSLLQKNFNNNDLYTKNFILGRDINLLDYIGLRGDQCLEIGDTFVSVGLYFVKNTDNECVLQRHPNVFSGSFDGNNFSISYFRFKADGKDNIGLFSTVGSSGAVSNLQLKKAEVEGGDATGGFVGLAEDSAKLLNLRISDSFISGESQVGSIVGRYSSSNNLLNLKAEKTEVEGREKIGGLVGEVESGSGTIAFSSFEGFVYEDGNGYAGGIVGVTSASISSVVSSGVINARGLQVGGIVGAGYGISAARSDMVIIDRNDSGTSSTRYYGGLAGSATSISETLFTGNIRTTCTGTICGIGGIAGYVTPGYSSFSSSTFLQTSLGGENGNFVSNVYDDSSLMMNICADNDNCPWSQVSKDMPRIKSVDDDHICANTANNESFVNQPGARGTQNNPLIICRPDQLEGMSGLLAHFSLKQNLNLSAPKSTNLGNLLGHLNGNDYLVHSYSGPTDTAETHKTLFNSIAAGASVKNLKLIGFNISTTDMCTNCVLAALAAQNDGTISRIEALENTIETLSDTATVAGLVGTNTGVIEFTKVTGLLKGFSHMGGLTSANNGVIRNNKIDVGIFAADTSPGVSILRIGGITGTSSKEVYQNIFRGNINLEGDLSVDYVGGIVGELQKVFTPAIVRDNEISDQVAILTGQNAINVGGIAGASNDSANVIKRNFMKGLVTKSGTNSTINVIAGNSNYSEEGNLNLWTHPTYEYSLTSTSSPSSASGDDDLCTMTVESGVSETDEIPGAFLISDRYIKGTLTQNGTVWALSFKPEWSCSSYSNYSYIKIYKGTGPVLSPTDADFRNNGYDLATFANEAELMRILNAHLGLLTTGVAVNPPVWVWEGEGYELFGIH